MALARYCLDMNQYIWTNMPQGGGVFEQDLLIMSHIELARKLWTILIRKMPNEHTDDDKDFIRQWGLDKVVS